MKANSGGRSQQWRNRIVGYSDEPPDQLLANPSNWRIHSGSQQAALAGALAEVGLVQNVIVNKTTGHVVDGHLRITLALRQNQPLIPVTWVELSEVEEKYILATIDPLAAMATADAAALDALLSSVNSGEAAVQAMLAGLAKEAGLYGEPVGDDPGPQIDKADELREKWGVEVGQLWRCGEHMVMCGNCTDAAVVGRLMNGEEADFMLTDPPYCSGGFQESGRSSGSVGTTAVHKKIESDTLSTRGYIALMKAMLSVSNVLAVYVFTDWRMWVNLFDAVESSGFGVRQMIVWDKMTPGMGHGWRAQHELIMFALKGTIAFDRFSHAQGNVIQAKRTGNELHTTQKPLDLLERILIVMQDMRTVYDPFLGSGTTLIACERSGRRCRGVEIAPEYVAVALERWATMTGKMPELLL